LKSFHGSPELRARAKIDQIKHTERMENPSGTRLLVLEAKKLAIAPPLAAVAQNGWLAAPKGTQRHPNVGTQAKAWLGRKQASKPVGL
jgi:hypothetical protein